MLKNNPADFSPNDGLLHGIYRGVVENNRDPEKMGRCQVRIFGVHSPNKEKTQTDGIPTEELPWAYPALGLTGGGVSGFGDWQVPLQGSTVYLFFERGCHTEPRYFASAPAKPVSQTHGFREGQGFSDPDGKYPAKHRLDEPDWHRLARDIADGTILDYKIENRTQSVQLGMGRGEWDEPEPFYLKSEKKYPNNRVIASHRGIIIEIDSSDEPRLHIYHPSNTYTEIDSEGNKIQKNTGNRFSITLKDLNRFVKEDYNLTVGGNRVSLVQGDTFSQIDGDSNTEIGGSIEIEIGGDNAVSVSGAHIVDVGGDCDINVSGNVNISAGGNVTISGSTIQLN